MSALKSVHALNSSVRNTPRGCCAHVHRPSVIRHRACEGGVLVDVPSNTVDERIADIKSRLVREKHACSHKSVKSC